MSNNEALNTIHYLGIVMDYLAIEVSGVQEFTSFRSSRVHSSRVYQLLNL